MKAGKMHNIIIVVIAIVCVISLGCYTHFLKETKIKNAYVYEEHLDDQVVMVDNQTITLREFGYYIVKMEEIVQGYAMIYNEEDPTEYWKLHFSAGLDTGYMFEYAWNYAVADCICDLVLEQKAMEEGYTLTVEECRQAIKRANEIYAALSTEQIEKTGLTVDIITQIEGRKKLAERYAEGCMTNEEISAYIDDVVGYIKGYNESVTNVELAKYEIVYNESMEQDIRMGEITVNCGNV